MSNQERGEFDPCVNCGKPTPTEEWVVHQTSCRDCFHDQMEGTEMNDMTATRLDRATHRCKVCDARWIQNVGGTWSLASAECGQCCDNVPMGDQIEPLREYRGWAITFDYGFYAATGPDYEASYEGPEDGWVDNGQRIEARNLEDLRAEIDAWLDEQGK